MPVLNWIGKDAVVRHDAEVPFHLLHDVPELACPVRPERSGPPGREVEGPIAENSTDNFIVEGDNLLASRKFRLREVLATRLSRIKHEATAQELLALLEDEEHLHVNNQLQRMFGSGRYAWDYQYSGFVKLERHFFPQIGNLKPDGEEFDCAQSIANEMKGVESWIRNVERKPGSFSLPTSSDRFCPDFLIRLTSGVLLVVEYKGDHLADGADSREKEVIGKLWARRSDGHCRFAMVTNRRWQGIEALTQ